MTSLSSEQIRNGHVVHAAMAERFRSMTSQDEDYAVNRLSGLVHHYLALLGDPHRRLESFEELFDDEFMLDFASGRITTLPGFEEWVSTYTSSTQASTLTLEKIDVVDHGDATFTGTIDFEWAGLMMDGTHMEMATRHVWDVIDTPAEPFARIRRIGVVKTREMAPRSERRP